MATMTDERFLQCYGSLLIATWGDPGLKTRFKTSPGAVLKEFGLDPEGATINLKNPQDPGPDCTKESQIKMWHDGLQAGKIDFVYPEEPPEGIAGEELSEAELESVAGGVFACCCCTPCCCCSGRDASVAQTAKTAG